MTLPNFLIIGAAKSGTTALHHYLRQHPQVFMSPVHTTYFFSADGRPFACRGPHERATMDARTILTRDDYQALFDGAAGYPAVGENCPSYLRTPGACQRIAQLLPDVKLVAILRHPTDRAFSDYRMRLGLGYEDLSFEEALEAEPQRIAAGWCAADYLRKGYYARQLGDYYATFGASRIKVLLFDDLRDRPRQLLGSLRRFLGIDAFEDWTLEPHNRSGRLANPVLRAVWERSNSIRDRLRPYLPTALREAVSTFIDRSPRAVLSMDGATRRRLDDMYRQEIEDLSALTGLDLGRWLERAS